MAKSDQAGRRVEVLMRSTSARNKEGKMAKLGAKSWLAHLYGLQRGGLSMEREMEMEKPQ